MAPLAVGAGGGRGARDAGRRYWRGGLLVSSQLIVNGLPAGHEGTADLAVQTALALTDF